MAHTGVAATTQQQRTGALQANKARAEQREKSSKGQVIPTAAPHLAATNEGSTASKRTERLQFPITPPARLSPSTLSFAAATNEGSTTSKGTERFFVAVSGTPLRYASPLDAMLRHVYDNCY